VATVVLYQAGAGNANAPAAGVQHLLWGLVENPLAFFLVPCSIAAALTLWFGLALLILLQRSLENSPGSLQGLTEACNHVVVAAPQTCIIFALAFHATLILFHRHPRFSEQNQEATGFH
jgi:hypothetical protein